MRVIDRKEKIEEMKLRSLVRRGIKIILERKEKEINSSLQEEMKLRKIISNIILETATADNDPAPHRSTGINVLEDLLKKIIPVIETDYKKLTTSEEQRDSFRAHTIQAVKTSLTPVRVNDEASDNTPAIGSPEELEEQEDINISLDNDDTKPKEYEKEDFIDIGLKSDNPTKPKDADVKDSFGIEGKDVTGRNVAYESFKKIEKGIIDAYDVLSNEEDRELFYDYLITNLKLYFDKFEKDLSATPEEPTTDEYEAATDPAAASPVPGL
jgi:hypothetical protein